MNIKQMVKQSNEYRNWKESRSEEKIEWAFGFVFTILMVGLLILIMQ